MVVRHLWIWTMFKAKAKVRVPRHVTLVEKLVMFPKTVGMASQRVLQLHLRPLARAQAQKAHLLVRVPRVQRDLQKEKASHPKERAKARWDAKSGKQYAVENQEDAQQWSEEPEAEGQETWNEEAWPDEDGQWEEQTGEQGAICVAASADSAQQAPRQRELTKYEKALEGEQKEFMLGKIWKRPEVFWNMQFRLVCNQSCYDGKFYCGYQRCKNKGFGTSPSQFNQHLRSKVGTAWTSRPRTNRCLGEETPMKFQKDADTMDFGIQRLVNMLNAKVEDWLGFNTFEGRHREEQGKNEKDCCKEATC